MCWADFAQRHGADIPGGRSDEVLAHQTPAHFPGNYLRGIDPQRLPPPRHPMGRTASLSGPSGLPPNEIQLEIPRQMGQLCRHSDRAEGPVPPPTANQHTADIPHGN
eukprot:527455-Pyramimonas_sp.AAC.1